MPNYRSVKYRNSVESTRADSEFAAVLSANSSSGSSTISLADMDALVARTGMEAGDQALVQSNKNLYIYTGTGWYKIATVVNTQPSAISGVEAIYPLTQNGVATIVTAVSSDPEDVPLTWSYAVTSGSLGNTASITQSGNVFTITPSTNEADAGTFEVTFSATDGVTGAVSATSSFTLAFPPTPSGILYSTPGTYSWTCPAGVTSVSVVAIGGGGAGGYAIGFPGNATPRSPGGGGGGGLGWKNNIAVSAGTVYTVVVGAGGTSSGSAGANSYFISTSTVAGFGGAGGHNGWNSNYSGSAVAAQGGSYVGDGGGAGGTGAAGGSTYSTTTSGAAGAGGGAGGYSGAGGNGSSSSTGSAGSGGAGGGGSTPQPNTIGPGGNGGGVGAYGQGSNGAGGTTSSYSGKGGSNGTTSDYTGNAIRAGSFGGGGGGATVSNNTTVNGSPGANGAVRIIWGENRLFPSTSVDAASSTEAETTV
jgi:hypothetical protein